LHALTKEFAETQLHELRTALKARDAGTFARTFAAVADHCNECHRTAHREFIEVPRQPGVSVPRLDPVPDAADGTSVDVKGGAE
jgi:hypothetical protein